MGEISLDGKKVMFIGNSFVYYGNCVIKGEQGKEDKGYFYQLARSNCESVTVIDQTYGGRTLKYIYENHLPRDKEYYADFDCVFKSEAGQNNEELVDDCKRIMELFPKTVRAFYLCHEYTYKADHKTIKDAFLSLRDMGFTIVNWGELVYDIWNGSVSVPNAALNYDRWSFIKNNKGFVNGYGAVGEGGSGDCHHQNPLSGYLTALMSYCAATGKSAVGQDFSFCSDAFIHPFFDFEAFKRTHYNGVTETNFDKIFNSEADMKGLQLLADKYLEKYNNLII